MRGKIVVILFVAASVAFSAYAAWYLFNRSPIDQRFNLARQAVPSVGGSALLPRSLDEFQRSGNVTSPAAGTSEATYTDNQYAVDFAVSSVKGQDAAQTADILGKPACQNASGSVISHAQNNSKILYSYSVCQNTYIFRWINGDWLFSASGSDSEALLRFVNLYGY